MSWGLIGLAAAFMSGALAYVGASFLVRTRHENIAWSTLWGAGLVAALLSPVAGFAIVMWAPQAATTVTESPLFHDALPSLVARAPLVSAELPAGLDIDWTWLGALSLAIYASGAVFFLLRLWIGRRRVRRIALSAHDLDSIKSRTVFVSSQADMPFVWSPFGRPSRSRIVLPEHYLSRFTALDLDQVIAHEQAHIDRRDDEWGLMLRAIVALVWFSPFSHLAFSRWAQACELQCDALILRDASHQTRAAYAQVLLKALQITANRVRQYPAATFSNDRLRNEKMRIINIMSGNAPLRKRRVSKSALIGALTSMSLATGVGFANVANADLERTKADTGSTITLSDMVSGRLTAPFGKSFDPFRDGSTRVHNGVDIAAPIGTVITAPADGIIVDATDLYDDKPAYGKVVVLATANDTVTLFSHLDSYAVAPGQQVKKGAPIAAVGNTGKSTGPHVHIETTVNGERVDPLSVWAPQD